LGIDVDDCSISAVKIAENKAAVLCGIYS
jgi:hypothetical protein